MSHGARRRWADSSSRALAMPCFADKLVDALGGQMQHASVTRESGSERGRERVDTDGVVRRHHGERPQVRLRAALRSDLLREARGKSTRGFQHRLGMPSDEILEGRLGNPYELGIS